jgi:hypothetical protein
VLRYPVAIDHSLSTWLQTANLRFRITNRTKLSSPTNITKRYYVDLTEAQFVEVEEDRLYLMRTSTAFPSGMTTHHLEFEVSLNLADNNLTVTTIDEVRGDIKTEMSREETSTSVVKAKDDTDGETYSVSLKDGEMLARKESEDGLGGNEERLPKDVLLKTILITELLGVEAWDLEAWKASN